jgi:uracil-DNA glycosylase
LAEARACRHCEAHLPLGPRPVLRAGVGAAILIIGQAPGTRVHASGIPWDDASGERLRAWMGIDRATFYDESRIAIVPMGLCYPGVDARGGDRPPRPECAPLWHPRILPLLPRLELTLLVGSHAQKRYLAAPAGSSLDERVRGWAQHIPACLPLPHPSWRNTAWLRRRPWFEAEVLPWLRERVERILANPRGMKYVSTELA